MREIILSDWIYRIVRVVYVVLFFYAGVNKLLNPRAFATVIDAFGLVPDHAHHAHCRGASRFWRSWRPQDFCSTCGEVSGW